MTQSRTQHTLWLNAAQTRFFLIPANVHLLAGDFLLRSLGGKEQRVNEATLAPFEVSEEQLQTQIQAELRQSLSGADSDLAGFLRFAGLLDEEDNLLLPTNVLEGIQPYLPQIAALLGVSTTDLRKISPTFKAAIRKQIYEFQDIFTDIAAPEPTRQQAGRVRLQALVARLKAQGVDVGTIGASLPEKLQTFLHLDQEPSVANVADMLRSLADDMEQSPEKWGSRFAEAARYVETAVDSLFNQDPQHTREQKLAEYRTSARKSIAKALKARNITTRTTARPSEHHESDSE
jgi:hypothetical protein